MSRVFVLLVIVVCFLGGLLVWQASTTATSIVLLPSQVVQEDRIGRDLSRIRVAGRVAATSISYSVDPRFELRFSVTDPPSREDGEDPPPQVAVEPLPVVYRGIKPDMFAPGRDVILDGSFEKGELVASRLLTQCPSKYEPPTPGDEGEKVEPEAY